YYLTSTRAEGACLPLQDFMASSRPGLAPDHTAMADYFGEDTGYVVESNPEPTACPHDPAQRPTTPWHRIAWQSLFDQLRASYTLAKQDQKRYHALAACGRKRIEDFASAERVWPLLEAALAEACEQGAKAKGQEPEVRERKAA